MVEALAAEGHECISYAPLPDDMPSGIEWKGTRWYRLEDVDWSQPGIWVLYRDPPALDNFDLSRKDQVRWQLLQDWDMQTWTPERIAAADRIIPLCHAHERWLLNRRPEMRGRTWVTRNGLRGALLREVEAEGIPPRNYKRVMFASSPDRGLLTALKIYARAKEFVPDLEFHATYGYGNIDKLIAQGAKHFVKDKEETLRLAEETGATLHGRLTQKELYKEWEKTAVWTYITSFWETGCELAGSLIATKNGMKKIEDIEVGDLVLTHKGRFQRVTKLKRRVYEGKLYTIKRRKDFRPITVTAEHPLYVGSFHRRSDAAGGRVTNKDDYYAREWMLPDQIVPKLHWLVTPKMAFGDRTTVRISDYVPFEVKDGMISRRHSHPLWKKAKDEVELTEDFMYLLGNWAAEGCAVPGKGRRGKGREWYSTIKTAHHARERHIAERHAAFFGGKVVEVSENEVGSITHHSVWANFLQKIIGTGRNKHIPDFVWETDEQRQRAFVQGYLDGDGYKSKTVNTDSYSSVSPSLAYGIAQLLANIGIFPSIHYSPERDAYTASWQREDLKPNHIEKDDCFLSKVESVESRWYCGDVYNFEVEEDRSYVTDRTVVHNCITGLEAMALGAIPVFSPIWAQGENIRFGIPVPGDPNDPLTIAKAAAEVVRLTANEEGWALQDKIRAEMMPHTRANWDWTQFSHLKPGENWVEAAEQDLAKKAARVTASPYPPPRPCPPYKPGADPGDEASETDARTRWLRLSPGDVMIDVGANRGSWSVPALEMGATVHAVDASDQTSWLQEWAEAARGKGHPGTLYLHPFNATAEGDTALDALALPNVSFVKVDVEGQELDVLRGMAKTLRKFRPRLMVEVHTKATPGR
ncbi:MAG TPA: LAGLIDADG family homing endonuclease, partial [Planctomycetota bacterium]|nr:LAGLIDADG family homing endonuclease [Planctomycetota bacterium]